MTLTLVWRAFKYKLVTSWLAATATWYDRSAEVERRKADTARLAGNHLEMVDALVNAAWYEKEAMFIRADIGRRK